MSDRATVFELILLCKTSYSLLGMILPSPVSLGIVTLSCSATIWKSLDAASMILFRL